ncbi:MAG: 3-dehydroquinate synthase [Clostridia bacterium]|nr:3-dehydroquinate synthase [Clostridia bacterium]
MYKTFFSSGAGYPAYIGGGALSMLGRAAAEAAAGRKAAVVTDSGIPAEHVSRCTEELRSAGFEVFLMTLPAGERSKTLGTVSDVYGFLIENSISRSDAVVGLGGGVVGDTAGFAAATYMRGTAFVSVPTTVISQTDSAYGGKTGVDHGDAKNMIGCFYDPRAVICDTDLLKTLPEAEITNGLGEIIKYGAIADPELLAGVSRGLPSDAAVFACAEIKRRFVEADRFDLGERRVLNFGHTLGHGYEAASGFVLPHGQAVAYGMLAVTRLGERIGVTEAGSYGAILSACERAGLDSAWEGGLPAALPYIRRDKKSDGCSVDAVLIERPGAPIRKKLPFSVLADERNYR